MSHPVETGLLIVGAGPAGASLAAFLASYGLKGICISNSQGTAKEPRAHITNSATLECLRDIGLEDECRKAGRSAKFMEHVRWCYSMAGEEIARSYAWGSQPSSDYVAVSPCRHMDLPQNLLEPILKDYASHRGWSFRFNCSFNGFERDDLHGPILSRIKDTLTGEDWTIRSRYLFACDGARSSIVRQLALPLLRYPSQGRAFNVLINADLSHLMDTRVGNLHYIFQPQAEFPPWACFCVMRMVKPWYEWMVIFLPHPEYKQIDQEPSLTQYSQRIRDIIGDDTPFEIIDSSPWTVHEVVAEKYNDGNIFCLGDSTHRHPPAYGLGANTCVQDAYNLAWKVAYIEHHKAGPGLLDSFTLERQPVGAGVVRSANQAHRDNAPIMEALGMSPLDIAERKRQHAELSANNAAGRHRRQKLVKAIDYAVREYRAIGTEMNHHYISRAIRMQDESCKRPLPTRDPVLCYEPSTYPGSRLPHAWLNKRTPSKSPVSTIDLAGRGAFCLFTGLGGDQWKAAATEVGNELQIPFNAYSIGWRQDWEDVYNTWEVLRGVEEDGCVVCRPDRFVCWRSPNLLQNCMQSLKQTVKDVLAME